MVFHQVVDSLFFDELEAQPLVKDHRGIVHFDMDRHGLA
jgi:hypothetical protein